MSQTDPVVRINDPQLRELLISCDLLEKHEAGLATIEAAGPGILSPLQCYEGILLQFSVLRKELAAYLKKFQLFGKWGSAAELRERLIQENCLHYSPPLQMAKVLRMS